MPSQPQPRPVLGKSADRGHPLSPVPALAPDPEPEAAPVAVAAPPAAIPTAAPTASGRILKLPVTYRLPIALLDRLDAYVTPERKRGGESKESIAASAIDAWLKKHGA